MKQIETLEGRTLFSATITTILTDDGAVAADVKVLAAAVQEYGPTYLADTKALTADIKALPKSKTNVTLLNNLVKDQAHCFAALKLDYATLIATNTKAFTKITPDAMKSMADPSDLVLKAKLGAEITAIEASAASSLTKFFSDMGACGTMLSTDAAALVTANPTATHLAGDLQMAGIHAHAALTTIEQDLLACQAGMEKVLGDFAE